MPGSLLKVLLTDSGEATDGPLPLTDDDGVIERMRSFDALLGAPLDALLERADQIASVCHLR